jgi:hypothetical protein
MHIMSKDYRQLFHCCRIVFQASFPFRLGMIDGGHRIITALASIYNMKPTTNLGSCEVFLEYWPPDDEADETILNLGKVCDNARFKMCWPNSPRVNNKQNYDLSVSLLAYVSADIRRNEHYAVPHSVRCCFANPLLFLVLSDIILVVGVFSESAGEKESFRSQIGQRNFTIIFG